MTCTTEKTSLAFLLMLCFSPAVWAGDKQDVAAHKTVRQHLKNFPGADSGRLTVVGADCLNNSFEKYHFFSLRFRLYPVAVSPPAPLTSRNLFIVANGKVIQLTEAKELEQFFKENLHDVNTDKAMSAAAACWLRLVREFHHDGFFRFEEPVVQVKQGVIEGTLKVVQKQGNQGKLTVRMQFKAGKLASLESGGKLLPGIRPRCQATRLLDPDLAVREIMRRDLLVMGRSCKWYLDEQHTKASPELQKAIDGVWQQILAEDR